MEVQASGLTQTFGRQLEQHTTEIKDLKDRAL